MGKSARQRKEKDANSIKLAQPDRSGPSEKTLLELAQERNLFDQADRDPRNKHRPQKKPKSSDEQGNSDSDDEDDEDDDEAAPSPFVERIFESILWTISLSMLHFTLDVLVQQQYGMSIEWDSILGRTAQSFIVFIFIFYFLHPHPSSPILVPGLPLRYQWPLRQAIFFMISVGAGCHLIYITNEYSYLAVLKRAPTMGSLWVWAIIELPLLPASGSLAIAAAYIWQGGYTIIR